MKRKVFDVQQPTDKWEEGYAHLEYRANELRAVGDKRIEVDQVFYCLSCGQENTYYRHSCERCEALGELQG